MINTSHPAKDIAFRNGVLGHERAVVAMEPDMNTFRLITTGSHEQVVALCSRLNNERNGKGAMYLNRRIDADGTIL